MQRKSETMSSTKKKKSKALPCGRIRFYTVWSELKDFWAPSLLRNSFAFQQELLKKCRVLKKRKYVLISIKFRALLFCYSLIMIWQYLSWPKKSRLNSMENKWLEHVATMHLSQLGKQKLILFSLKGLWKFKYESNGMSI